MRRSCKPDRGLRVLHAALTFKTNNMPEQNNDAAMGSSTLDAKFTSDPQPTARQMTFGEKLVGITFNPSADDKVAKAKQLFAEAADLLWQEVHGGAGEISELQSRLFQHTVGEILNAQMNVVKVLTLKY